MRDQKYCLTDLGAPTTFLVWTVQRNHLGPIHISQVVLISKPLQKVGLTGSKARSKSLPKNLQFDEARQAPPLSAPTKQLFQYLLGDLRYLADSTRLNIAFAVSRLAQPLMQPTEKHMQLLKCSLRYLIGTKSYGLLYQQSNDATLPSYTDANLAVEKLQTIHYWACPHFIWCPSFVVI